MAELRVTVVGLGYIGLPTAAVLARQGYQVQGYDVNTEVVEKINQGQIHIVEKDLDALVASVVTNGHFRAFTMPQPADVLIIAVPTPFLEGHKPDLSYVESATRAIAPILQPGNLVILESTCPVGATEWMAELLEQLRPDLHVPTEASGALPADDPLRIFVAHCPERVLPGHIIRELVENDRIVGGIDAISTQKAQQFYQTFVTGAVVSTNASAAELSKLVENAYRDVNIAFANELSLICDQLGLNVWEIIELANRHPRVNVLKPGVGVGGHCLAVDPWFIVDVAPEQARLIRTAREINDYKPAYWVQRILARLADGCEDLKIACLGLSYKPDIDDLRESPSVWVVEQLAHHLPALYVVEPHIQQLPSALTQHAHIELINLEQALQWCDVLILLVDHQVFKKIPTERRNSKITIDATGVWRS